MEISPFVSRFSCLLLAAGLSLPTVAPSALSPSPRKDASPGPERTHVLFMGADLEVQRNNRYHRVEDVEGSELKIRIGKREVFVPTRRGTSGLKINHGLKLASTSVRLDGLQSGPAYTPLNDPVRKFNAASGAAGGAAAVRDLAYGRMISAEISLAAATNALANTAANSPSRGLVEAAYAAAAAEYEAGGIQAASANEFTMSDEFNTAEHADRMKLDLAEGNHDAMEVSFRISSPVVLDDPYMVILFKFRERDAKPGVEGLLVHAKSLDPIGPKPKYIRVREAGLPRGFQYLDCTVHVYNRGVEVATNASPKRVELTRGEAKQYLVIEHLGANKGATVPAVAVPGTLPLTHRQALSSDQLNRLCYAKVAEDGSLLGAYLDESCHQPLEDAGAVSALEYVLFKPALKNGKPVEGVVRLTLGSI